MNDKAVINRTGINIPDDIMIGLSFGWKFLFPFMTTEKNINSILAELGLCIEESVPVLYQNETFRLVTNAISKRCNKR